MTSSGVMDDDPVQSPSPDESSDGHDHDHDHLDHMAESNSGNHYTGSGKPPNGLAKSAAKDPNRPRRKKARRACYACQRAHLTCGDERPCQRCIKRGLADVCQDGVRKKAKYLHDAPNEALLPGAANLFTHTDLKRNSATSQPDETHSHLFQQTASYPVFTSTPTRQMPPPVVQARTSSFSQTPSSDATFTVGQQLHSPISTRDQSVTSMPTSGSWANPLFNTEDPSLFNFDLASMNFGNHYGALEFGMLGHMATAAGDTPESETATQRGSVAGQFPMPFGSISESPHFGYGEPMMGDWTTNNNGMYPHMSRKPDPPHAFAIESSAHFTSPEANTTTPEALRHDDSPHHLNVSVPRQKELMSTFLPLTQSERVTKPPPISTPQLKAKTQLPGKSNKRPRDPSSIYTSVDSPYPYTSGFHSLIAYLQKRFSSSPSKTLAIAKSLASIRPSFIATTKTLNREDLIFMEKCFQRTLWEYESFIESVGTPTIVARRTGEIAAVGKEFQILTGWKKNVLLGREPNLNINKGHTGLTPAGSGSGSNTTGRATGTTTPLLRYPETDGAGGGSGGEGRQQPVFLAELLDDDSIVQFYEDFARLAFGDSRGSVMSKGKLLKYRTKDDEIAANLQAEAEKVQNEEDGRFSDGISHGGDEQRDGGGGGMRADNRLGLRRLDSFAVNRPQDAKKGISGEKGMQRLGSGDGKVDCAYCWTVKRDVFDIPMLIVMNFLPCI